MKCRTIGIAAVDLFFYDTLFVISPVALVVLGCASFGLLAGVVMLVYLLLRKRR
jgi:heme/copper-type cytochrome/quinol oxidase subunit 1